MSTRPVPTLSQPGTTVALLPWGNVVEDFLDTVGVSLEEFCTTFTGSWLFGYVDALRTAGIQTVVIAFSSTCKKPVEYVHRPTGATMCVLPVSRLYPGAPCAHVEPLRQKRARCVRKHHRRATPILELATQIAPYLCTPPRRLATKLRRERCVAMLCQEYEYPRFDVCVLVGGFARVRTIGVFQGGDYRRWRLERLVRPLSMRAVSGLAIGPRAEIGRVRARYAVDERKIARIFDSIDLAAWSPGSRAAARAELGIPEMARVAAWHGRVSIAKKGLDVLLDSWQGVVAGNYASELRLLLIGTGDHANELRHEIETRGLPGILWLDEFISNRATMARYLSAADVYAFPSRHEGFPVAPIEAMACDLPVVAAGTSGVEDIFEGGERSGGVVVPCGDAGALARAVAELLADDARSHELGVRARRRVEEAFSTEAVGAQLRTFLDAR